MELKTYRAKSIREALALVRRELGPDAAVLGTREVRGGGGVLGWLGGERLVEVIASAEVAVPSRLPPRPAPAVQIFPPRFTTVSGIDLAKSLSREPGRRSRRRPAGSNASPPAWIAAGARLTSAASATFQRLLCSLIDVETAPDLARELAVQVMRLCRKASWDRLAGGAVATARRRSAEKSKSLARFTRFPVSGVW